MEKLNDSPRGEEEANQFLSSSLTRPLSEIVHVCVCVCVCPRRTWFYARVSCKPISGNFASRIAPLELWIDLCRRKEPFPIRNDLNDNSTHEFIRDNFSYHLMQKKNTYFVLFRELKVIIFLVANKFQPKNCWKNKFEVRGTHLRININIVLKIIINF